MADEISVDSLKTYGQRANQAIAAKDWPAARTAILQAKNTISLLPDGELGTLARIELDRNSLDKLLDFVNAEEAAGAGVQQSRMYYTRTRGARDSEGLY